MFITAIDGGINIAVAAPQVVRVLSSAGSVIFAGTITTATDVLLPTSGIYIISGENEAQKILFQDAALLDALKGYRVLDGFTYWTAFRLMDNGRFAIGDRRQAKDKNQKIAEKETFCGFLLQVSEKCSTFEHLPWLCVDTTISKPIPSQLRSHYAVNTPDRLHYFQKSVAPVAVTLRIHNYEQVLIVMRKATADRQHIYHF